MAFLAVKNQEAERIRRTIMVITAGYIISGWMIDRSYYVEYFLIAAVSGAMHRLRQNGTLIANLETGYGDGLDDLGGKRAFGDRLFRRGFGLADAFVSLALTYATLLLWDYILVTL
jgi:hypothetical protein